MNTLKRNCNVIWLLIAVFFLLCTAVFSRGALSASADTVSGSPVLEDLQRDKDFKVGAYKSDKNDYSLNVIQIAESTAGELLIYVHQPSGQAKNIKASSINIAKSANEGATWKNYKLEYCNSTGVFFKYKVAGFTLESGMVRYYNISNILRRFIKGVDKEPGGDNTVSEVPNRVAQLWAAYEENDKTVYEMQFVDVIEVTKKYVGYVMLSDGMNTTEFGNAENIKFTNAHFVAFSLDMDVDRLKEIDISFCEQEVQCKLCMNKLHKDHDFAKFYGATYGEKKQHEPNPVTITYKQKSSNEGGWYPLKVIDTNRYEWDCIRSTKDFLDSDELKNSTLFIESKEELQNTDWVVNFYNTPVYCKEGNIWKAIFTFGLGTDDADCKGVIVSDVIILRLFVEKDGHSFNLGVIDNKQTGSVYPINTPSFLRSFLVPGLIIIGSLVAVAIVYGIAKKIIGG